MSHSELISSTQTIIVLLVSKIKRNMKEFQRAQTITKKHE